jgi:hypothetical protein
VAVPLQVMAVAPGKHLHVLLGTVVALKASEYFPSFLVYQASVLIKLCSKNCALPGAVCCGDTACNVGEKCCLKADGSQSHCAPESGSCCGDGYCTKGKTCCNNGFGCVDPGYICCGNALRQSCPIGSKCCLDTSKPDAPVFCAKDCVPTLRFPHIEGIMDEVSAIL